MGRCRSRAPGPGLQVNQTSPTSSLGPPARYSCTHLRAGCCVRGAVHARRQRPQRRLRRRLRARQACVRARLLDGGAQVGGQGGFAHAAQQVLRLAQRGAAKPGGDGLGWAAGSGVTKRALALVAPSLVTNHLYVPSLLFLRAALWTCTRRPCRPAACAPLPPSDDFRHHQPCASPRTCSPRLSVSASAWHAAATAGQLLSRRPLPPGVRGPPAAAPAPCPAPAPHVCTTSQYSRHDSSRHMAV